MRIINEINIGRMKISIFKMGDKTSVKFEKDLNEIIIKFRDGAIDEATLQEQFLSEEVIKHYESLLDNAEHCKIDKLIKIEEDRGVVFPEII
jgi:hypothetical protein